MPNKRATSADVARHAGVSRTTVSMVLNGNDASISEQTRRRVFASVRELRYVPNAVAQSLRASDSRLILMPNPGYDDADTVAEFVPLLRESLRERGFQFVLETDLSGSVLERAQRWTERRPWMVLSVPSIVDATLAEALRDHGVQQILLTSDKEWDYASSAVLTGSVGQLAAKHLVTDLGHSDIALVVPKGSVDADFSEHRFREFETYANGHGARVRRYEVGLTRDDFTHVVRLWSIERSLPTAVYAHNDVYALALIDALRTHDINVPAEVSVVGTDNTRLASLFTPRLTSVYFDLAVTAEALAQKIAELYQLDSTDRAVFESSVGAQIAIRDSSDAPREYTPSRHYLLPERI